METLFEVIIEALPDDHIPVLRAIRKNLGLGLKEAKELFFYIKSDCPCLLITGIEKTVAENFTSQLISAGADVTVQTSSIRHPMLVFPRLDNRYQEHWLFGLRRIDGQGQSYTTST